MEDFYNEDQEALDSRWANTTAAGSRPADTPQSLFNYAYEQRAIADQLVDNYDSVVAQRLQALTSQMPADERESPTAMANARQAALAAVSAARTQANTNAQRALARARQMESDAAKNGSGSKDYDSSGKVIHGSPTWARIQADDARQKAFGLRVKAAEGTAAAQISLNASREWTRQLQGMQNDRAERILELTRSGKTSAEALKIYEDSISVAKKNADENFREYQSQRNAVKDTITAQINIYRANTTQYGQQISQRSAELRNESTQRNKDLDKITEFAKAGWEAAVKLSDKLVSPETAKMMVLAIRAYGKKHNIAAFANWSEFGPDNSGEPGAPKVQRPLPTAADYTTPGDTAGSGFSGTPTPTEGKYQGATGDEAMGIHPFNPDENVRFNPYLRGRAQEEFMRGVVDRTPRTGPQGNAVINPVPPEAPYVPVAPTYGSEGINPDTNPLQNYVQNYQNYTRAPATQGAPPTADDILDAGGMTAGMNVPDVFQPGTPGFNQQVDNEQWNSQNPDDQRQPPPPGWEYDETGALVPIQTFSPAMAGGGY